RRRRGREVPRPRRHARHRGARDRAGDADRRDRRGRPRPPHDLRAGAPGGCRRPAAERRGGDPAVDPGAGPAGPVIDRLPGLIASDLDGTLLRGDGTVSDRTRAALQAATEAGSAVLAATGRPPRWVEGLHLDLGVDALCVCMNGAMLLDLDSGEVLDHLPFAEGVAAEIAAAVREALPGVIFAGQLGARFAREPDWEAMYPHASDLVAPLDELVAETVTKL